MENSSTQQTAAYIPLISVIIPVLNNVGSIRDTIESVITQTYKGKEIIIIDGGSNDGTTGIIEEYSDKIKFWSSEKDDGVYDAMNKGIENSNGDWLLFLGGDDRLIDNTVFERIFSNDVSLFYMVFGDVKYLNGKKHRSCFGTGIYFHNTIHHQGAFYNRKCFTGFRFNSNYKILADYELNLLLYARKLPCVSGMKVKKNQGIVSICGAKGISKRVTWQLYKEELKMKRKIVRGYFMSLLFVWVCFKYLVKKTFFNNSY